ncbi:hypothetical protein Tco_0304836 [Tanacetum coccineum]
MTITLDDPNITMEEYIRLEEEKAHRCGKVYNWETATYGSLNNEIDFRDSFDESNDEDYTVIFDKNLFSYKIISVNDLKMDSKNDNEKVNMPSFPLPEPTVSCFDDLDFFKDFENGFPAIVYNNAQMSKSDLLTEPILNPQHIDEFNLKDEVYKGDNVVGALMNVPIFVRTFSVVTDFAVLEDMDAYRDEGRCYYWRTVLKRSWN